MHRQGLRDLLNLGENLVSELESIGIRSVDDPMSRGSLEDAFHLIGSGHSVYASKLYALEGAIQGRRWHTLDAA